MKEELKKVQTYLENENILQPEQKSSVEKLLQHADNHLISKVYHDKIAKHSKNSRKDTIRSLLYFIIGVVVSSISYYFYYYDTITKNRVVEKNLAIIEELANRGAYVSAREMLEQTEKIDPANNKLLTLKLRLDISDVLNNGLPITKDLIIRSEVFLQHDSDNLWLNRDLAKLYQRNGDYSKAYKQVKRAFVISKKYDSYENIAANELQLAIYYMESGKYDSAKIYYKIVNGYLQNPTKFKADFEHIKEIYLNNFGRQFYFLGRSATTLQNTLAMADSALFYVDSLYKVQLANKTAMGAGKILKAEVLFDLVGYAEIERVTQNKDNIELAYSEAVEAFLRSEDYRGLSLAYAGLSYFYSVIQECEMADETAKKAIFAAQKFGSNNVTARALGNASRSAVNCKNYDQAFIRNQMAARIARKMGIAPLIEAGVNDSIFIAKFIKVGEIPRLMQLTKKEFIKLNMQ